MILIFTSVRDNRPLYKRDILNVCCESPGTQIQFAYRTKWIPQHLRSSPAALRGKEALIIYCERTKQPTGYFTFHPVRRAVISEATGEFDFMTLSLQLGEFFDYAAYGDDVQDVIDRFQTFITANKTDHPNHAAKPRFVREDDSWNEAGFSEGWAPLVTHISNVEGLHDAVFFSVQQRDKFGGPPIPLFPNPGNEQNRTTYLLKSGGTYDVSVLLMWGGRASYRDPELIVKESVASVSGPFVRQRSGGFQADFVVQCKRSFDEESSMLSLRVPPAEPNTFGSPRADVLIKLSPRKGTLLIAVVLLTLGAFLLSWTPETLAHFRLDWIAVLKLLGLMMLALGSYVGFRKLPS
ncbi:MAG: hypothetical protein QOJ64_2954 [Acidobacteriota bacterium]|jgi:hypothetical protein|nr:hypothetical protein [Acidobacteriota bacterium]